MDFVPVACSIIVVVKTTIPESRTCHTLINLRNSRGLMAGGREGGREGEREGEAMS